MSKWHIRYLVYSTDAPELNKWFLFNKHGNILSASPRSFCLTIKGGSHGLWRKYELSPSHGQFTKGLGRTVPLKEMMWISLITRWEVALRQKTWDLSLSLKMLGISDSVYFIQQSPWCWNENSIEGDIHVTHRGYITLRVDLSFGVSLGWMLALSLTNYVWTGITILTSVNTSFLICEIGLIMIWKPQMLTILINVHIINPNYIFEKFLDETKPRNKHDEQRQGWEEPDSYSTVWKECLTMWWLQSEIKSKQTVESFQASKLQTDIIIMFSQWAKDLARLGGRLGWGRWGKKGKEEAGLPGAYDDTWLMADLCQVQICKKKSICWWVQHRKTY